MNTGKVLLGILTGVAVGAAAGILLAPDKGSTTRKKISNKREAYTDDLEERFNKFVDGVSEKFETMKVEAGRMAKNGKAKAEEIEGKVSSAIN